MSGADKAGFIRRLFNEVSPRYDLFNRIASLGLDQQWRRRTIACLNLLPGMRVLDLASGTGDLAEWAVREIVPLGIVVACDPAAGMLRLAGRKFERSPPAFWHGRCVQAVAEALPFADASIDAATMAFALRNVSDLDATFQELRRVLKPGGRVGLLEFGKPSNPVLRLGHWLWLSVAVPMVGLITTGRLWPFLYLRRSILRFMPPEEMIQRLDQAGFTHSASQPLTGGAVYLYTACRS